MSNKYIFMPLVLVLLSILTTRSQPFIKEVRQFQRLDTLQEPPVKPILFIGSSSFTNWKDLAAFFPGHVVLNRAFGGSSLPHLIMYAEEVIFKYDPKQIIIYCGENDMTGGPQITADSVYQRFVRLHRLIRSRLPKVPVVYVSMKPSPSRLKYMTTMREANRLIERYIRKTPRTEYIDVHSKMLEPDGRFMSHIFLSDSLHMNRKGYEIWKPIIEPYLLK
jgi:lysophospholipase L1-like esterase